MSAQFGQCFPTPEAKRRPEGWEGEVCRVTQNAQDNDDDTNVPYIYVPFEEARNAWPVLAAVQPLYSESAGYFVLALWHKPAVPRLFGANA